MAKSLMGMISKQHFRITRDSTCIPSIEDTSKNGTYLNGGLLTKGSKSTLCTGDIIAIGSPRVEGNYALFSYVNYYTSYII